MAKQKSGLVSRYSSLGYGILLLLNLSMFLYMAIALYFVENNRPVLFISYVILSFIANIVGITITLHFRRSVVSLKQILMDLRLTALKAKNIGAELKESSTFVAKSAREQKVAIENIDGSMSLMGNLVSDTVDRVKSIVDRVSEKTDEGNKIMEEMVAAMETLGHTNTQLQNISGIIKKISSETNIINDIVFKTQLLSFNAFLEAARAGQHGSGFAVVAEEVGSLAQSSGNAAKEIRGFLEDSENQVEKILEGTKTRISDGKQTSDRAKTIFSDIVKNIVQQFRTITDVSDDQKEGIQETQNLVVKMKHSTEAAAQVSQKFGNLSQELHVDSNRLKSIADTLSSYIEGDQQEGDESKRSLITMFRKPEIEDTSPNKDPKLEAEEVEPSDIKKVG